MIKIVSSDNPEIFDISDGGFKIYGEGSEIRITTRLLNNRYNPGEEMLLEWESKNLLAYEVSIYFSEKDDFLHISLPYPRQKLAPQDISLPYTRRKCAPDVKF